MKKNLLLALVAFGFSFSGMAQTPADTTAESGFIGQGQWDGEKWITSSVSTRESETWQRLGLMFFDLSKKSADDIKGATLNLFLYGIEHHDGGWVDYDLSDVNGEAEFKLSILAYEEADLTDTSYTYLIETKQLTYEEVASVKITADKVNSNIAFTSAALTDSLKNYAGSAKKACLVLSTTTGNDSNPTKIRFWFHGNNPIEGQTIVKPYLSYEGGSATQNITLSSVNIYPNPADDIVTIDQDFDVLNIIDVTGKVVKTATSGVSEINVSDLKAGLYFVKVESAGKVYCSKLMIK